MTFWSTKIIFTHKTVWKLFWCLYRWQATQLLTFTCSKSTIEALEKSVKYVQSWQWRHHNDARTPMPKCDFNKVDLHFYWNRTSAWVFCSRSGDFIVNFKHISNLLLFSFFFCNCYLADPWPTLGHSQGDSLTSPMLLTKFFNFFDPKVTGSLVTRLGP